MTARASTGSRAPQGRGAGVAAAAGIHLRPLSPAEPDDASAQGREGCDSTASRQASPGAKTKARVPPDLARSLLWAALSGVVATSLGRRFHPKRLLRVAVEGSPGLFDPFLLRCRPPGSLRRRFGLRLGPLTASALPAGRLIPPATAIARRHPLSATSRAAVPTPSLRPAAAVRGFNLIELLMSMALATTVFMAITTLFVRQGEVIQQQNEQSVLNREARFGLDHLRADLGSLGSNTTPNSAIDPKVCPKPAIQLRALSLELGKGYVSAAALNPNVTPVSITLFGSLDIKTRFRTTRIEGTTVTLDPAGLPATQPEMDAIFAPDRFLRISGADGGSMFFPIVAANVGARTVTVNANIPRVANADPCGYTGLGANYNVDVQGFVRYRIVADARPGAKLDPGGKAIGSLLVRERLLTDGATVKSQLVLVENAVDLLVYDFGLKKKVDPSDGDVYLPKLVDEVVKPDGSGVLGTSLAARPEALRFLTVKLSVRTTWPTDKLVHRKREVFWQPLETWLLPGEVTGSHPVVTVAARVVFPTLLSRNL